MIVFLVADNLLLDGDSIPETLVRMTGLMVECGIWESEGVRSARNEEYQGALDGLLALECDDSFRALVTLDWQRGMLFRKGPTWLWIQKDGVILRSYTHLARLTTVEGERRSVPAASFLQVVHGEPRRNKDAWKEIFERDIKDALANPESSALS